MDMCITRVLDSRTRSSRVGTCSRCEIDTIAGSIGSQGHACAGCYRAAPTWLQIPPRARLVLLRLPRIPCGFEAPAPSFLPPGPGPDLDRELCSCLTARATLPQDGNGTKYPQIRGYRTRWTRIRVWFCTRGHGHGYNFKPNGYLLTDFKI